MTLGTLIEETKALLESTSGVETDPTKVVVVWDSVLGGRYKSKASLDKLVHHLRVETPFKIGKVAREEEVSLCGKIKPEAFTFEPGLSDPEPKCPTCVKMMGTLGLKAKL